MQCKTKPTAATESVDDADALPGASLSSGQISIDAHMSLAADHVGEGQCSRETHARVALPDTNSDPGQSVLDAQTDNAPVKVGEGQDDPDVLSSTALPDEFFADLRKAHRTRQFAMEARKRSDLALGAFLREQLGWKKDKTQAERSAIADRASALVTLCERAMKWEDRIARKPDTKLQRPDGYDDPDFLEWRPLIESSLRGREPMAQQEDIARARMCELAEQLPVAAWWRENVFSELTSLAVLVAEISDLSQYATVSKVWKRMGVAVMDGVRQGGLPRTASKEAWIAHGYVRRRRSHLFVVGDTLIKQNEHYRAIYLAEKEKQRAKAEAAGLQVVPSAKIPEKRKAEFMSDGHVHNRARRVMEKDLLRDLWVAWRRACSQAEPIHPLPANHSSSHAHVDAQIVRAADGSGHCQVDAHGPRAAPTHSSGRRSGEAQVQAAADGSGHVWVDIPSPNAAPTISADEADARGHNGRGTQSVTASRKRSAKAGNGASMTLPPTDRLPHSEDAEQSAEPPASKGMKPKFVPPEATP